MEEDTIEEGGINVPSNEEPAMLDMRRDKDPTPRLKRKLASDKVVRKSITQTLSLKSKGSKGRVEYHAVGKENLKPSNGSVCPNGPAPTLDNDSPKIPDGPLPPSRLVTKLDNAPLLLGGPPTGGCGTTHPALPQAAQVGSALALEVERNRLSDLDPKGSQLKKKQKKKLMAVPSLALNPFLSGVPPTLERPCALFTARYG